MASRVFLVIILSLSFVLQSTPAEATTLQHKGLFVSPSRRDVKVLAGNEARGSISVYNYYTKALHVDVSVSALSVIGKEYRYTLTKPNENWISIIGAKDGIDLPKNQTKAITYRVAAPKDAAPGDHYFAIVASTDMSGKGFQQKAQVVSVLYVQVGGGRIIRSAEIKRAETPFLAFSPTIHYAFDVQNTGNVHFDAYFFARLENLFGQYATNGADQVVLAKTTRRITGSIPMPALPGLYELAYGYKDGDQSGKKMTIHVLYMPPWFLVTVLLGGLAAVRLFQSRRQ